MSIHNPYPPLALASLEGDARANLLPRPGTLRPADRRAWGRSLAARIWRDVLADGDGAAVALRLGTDRATIHRYGTGEKLLPLGDVIAAPPLLAARVLRHGLEAAEGATAPVSDRGLVAEAIAVCAEAAELASRLEAAPPESLSAGALDDLIDWTERLAERLWQLGRRLRKVRDRKGAR